MRRPGKAVMTIMRTEIANYSPRVVSIGDSLIWGYFKKMKDLIDKRVAGETGRLLRILRPPHTGHPDHNSHPAGSRVLSIQPVLKSRPKKKPL
jgi:hypothetical protein